MSKETKLFRVWYFTQTDRSEVCRIKAYDFETVQQFLLNTFIKPEHKEEIELSDYGLSWNNDLPQDCLKDAIKDGYTEANIDNICECCDGCLVGYTIEELEDPQTEDYSLKTIFGTNDYYDLTLKSTKALLKAITIYEKLLQKSLKVDINAPNKEHYQYQIKQNWKLINEYSKATDHDPKLSKAWNESPTKGAAQLILSTIRDNPNLKHGFSKELIQTSKDTLKET